MANGKKWTDQDTQYLTENFPHMHTKDIAKIMGYNIATIYRRSKELGLTKSPKIQEEIRLINAEILRSGGVNTRFKKGQEPFNKGKKMPNEIKEKIRKTLFKTGHSPHNEKPDWTESIRHHKDTRTPYVYIKVPGYKKWPLKHRYIWEQHHGPIPAGHIIEFIDGNTVNCTLENLRLTPRNVQVLVNGIHKFPRDLSEVIILNNTLNTFIHEKQNPRS